MASSSARAGAGAGASPLEGLSFSAGGFFSSGSVDDQKYESLLADLRAHDLLGPSEPAGATATATAGSSSGSGASLFFNDAFSAVFLGSFSDNTSNTGKQPPPGFARAAPPPGLAATSDSDLKWAQGQQAFSRLEQQFSAANATSAQPDDAPDALDETIMLGLKDLGLDDDDAASPVSKRTERTRDSPARRMPSPAPNAVPPPPGAWQQQPPPPPQPPVQAQQQQQQVQQQYPQPPPMPGMQPHPHQHQQHYGPPPPRGFMPPPPHGVHPHPHGPPPPRPHHMPPHQPPYPPHGHMGPRGPPPMPHMRGQHPPPPPPIPYGMPPGAPWAHVSAAAPVPVAPRFRMMTPRDIQFVAQQQMKFVRCSDPFSDDYYFHNFVQKRTRAPSPSPAPSAIPGRGLPLPSWKLEHVKSVDPRDQSRAAKSREWETENHVLGRNNQRSLYRPRQLLNLSEGDGDSDESNKDEAVPEAAESTAEAPTMVVKTKEAVFSTPLWTKRHEIDRGLQCLLSLQDARHLLDARGINVQQFHAMDPSQMDPALATLREKTTRLLLELASSLGVVVAQDPTTHAATCDLEQLHRMLSLPKGKRLVSRALPLLHPSARFTLLPHLIDAVLSAAAVRQLATLPRDQAEEEERLCQALVLMLLYHPPAPSASVLADSLSRVMTDHDLATLRVLLYNRSRAEALQALLQRGGSAVGGDVSDAVRQQWHQAQEKFVALATAIKQTP
ncbi:hypothetical protein ATCC90586_001570 [Pythium insidiosum]|nr:hypothetical protein ATCC90586_001570 [Pythium insidiosum]